MPTHYGNPKRNGEKKMNVPLPSKLVKNPSRKGGKGSKAMKEKMAKLRAMRKKK
jgi:hypothetical protein